MPTVSEKGIIASLQAGDAQALHHLSRLYSRELCAIAMRITGSSDLAQEVFQDVLLNVWEQRKTLEKVVDLKAFLSKIARRRAIDLVRKERSQYRLADRIAAEQRPDLSRTVNQGANLIDAEDRRVLIYGVLNTLPPRCREIFLMHWEGGLSYAEIAETLEIARETVHKQMSRAMRTLVENLNSNRKTV